MALFLHGLPRSDSKKCKTGLYKLERKLWLKHHFSISKAMVEADPCIIIKTLMIKRIITWEEKWIYLTIRTNKSEFFEKGLRTK